MAAVEGTGGGEVETTVLDNKKVKKKNSIGNGEDKELICMIHGH